MMHAATTQQAPMQNALVLDGKLAAADLRAKTEAGLAALKQSPLKGKQGITPGLRVVMVGNNPASQVYVKKKAEMAKAMGINAELVLLPEATTEAQLLECLNTLNNDPAVHAILLQLPLPRPLNALTFQAAIAPHKDVDGFHPQNLGALMAGSKPAAIACTPYGCLYVLDFYKLPIAGKHAVVVGRSNIVGKPMAQLLLQRSATVTIAHSQTANLAEITRQADILVAAVGVPGLITATMVKPGAVVLDVGINRHPTTGKLVGDVTYHEVAQVAGAITPVPGGIGPMTIAMLMQNTLELCEQQVKR